MLRAIKTDAQNISSAEHLVGPACRDTAYAPRPDEMEECLILSFIFILRLRTKVGERFAGFCRISPPSLAGSFEVNYLL